MARRLWEFSLRVIHTWLVVWLTLGPTHPLIAATFYVDAVNGNDERTAEAAKDPATPWKSLTRASSASLVSGDVVDLAPGEYSEQTGETFPVVIPSGLTVVGSGTGETHLVSKVGNHVLTHDGPLAAGTQVENLSINSFSQNKMVQQGPGGFAIQGASGDANITFDSVYFESGLAFAVGQSNTGELANKSVVTLQNNTIESQFAFFYSVSAESASHDVDLTLTNNRISGNQGVVTNFNSSSGTSTFNISSQGNHYSTDSGAVYLRQYSSPGGTTWNVAMSGDTITGYRGVALTISGSSSIGNIDVDLDMTDCDIDVDESDQVHSGFDYLFGGGGIDASYTFSNNSFRGSSSGVGLSLYSLSNIDVTVDLNVEGNNFSNGYYGIYENIEYIDDMSMDINTTISGNTFRDLGGTALSISLSSMSNINGDLNTDFSGNDVEGVGDAVNLYTYYMYNHSDIDSDLTMSGNTISNVYGSGLSISFYSLETSGSFRRTVDVSDNTFTNVGAEYSDSAVEIFAYDVYASSSLSDDITISGNTILESGQSGIYAYVSSFSTASKYDLRATIVGNTINGADSDGIEISIYSFSTSGSADIDVLIAGNTISNVYDGIDISVSSLTSMIENHQVWDIHNNIIQNVNTGISFYSDYLGDSEDTDFSLSITGNTISQASSDGINVSLTSMSGEPLKHVYDIQVSGNTIDIRGEGSGIYLGMYGDNSPAQIDASLVENVISRAYQGIRLETSGINNTQAWTTIAGNTLTENYIGLSLSASSSIPTSRASDSEFFADLGGGSLSSPGNNIFIGNAQYDIDATSARGGATIPAQGNYFGTTDLEQIDARIGDNEESEGSANEVDFSSPRDTRPEVSAVATLTATISEDNQLEGPGPDDVVTYEAKLTSTGDIGCASGTFAIDLPDGMTLTNPIANRGTIIRHSATHLEVGIKWLYGTPATVQFDVNLANDDTCEAPALQGVFHCTQLGDIPTDDPATDAEGDATSLTYSTASFFADQDDDGWGDIDNTLTVCTSGTPAGYLPTSGDCDDDDDDIYPGAVELCDGQDNNCNEAIDDAAGAFWFADSDDDGQGNDEDSIQSCEQPSGYVAIGGDCNDTDEDVYQGATEVCNEIDDNCNGFIDEDVQLEFNADEDGDGYGDPGTGTISCEAPAGYVDNNLDCDDTDEDVSPDAEEVCDGIDNNCNNSTDEVGGNVYFGDGDDDGFGDPNTAVVGCGTAPSGYVANADDCDDEDEDVNPDQDEVCDGIDNNCDNDTDEDVGTFYFGDEDGDGYGSADAVVLACDEAPKDYVENSDDCDDTSEDVSPDGEEVCDGVDNNCNSDTDENVTTTWFADTDNDGFGGPSDVVQACVAPEGYLENSADCNDNDAAINPDATDVCDSVDNDCSGVADDGEEVCDVVPTEASPTPDIDVSGGGCGCAAPEDKDSQRGAFLMLVGLALWRRRRS